VGFSDARFHYFRDTPPYGWENLEIDVRREPVAPEWAVRYVQPKPPPARPEIGINPAHRPEGFWTPQAVPANLPSPDVALKRLQRAFYVRRDGVASVWLTRSGDPYRPVFRGPRTDWHTFFTANVPPARWIWWTVVERLGSSPPAGVRKTLSAAPPIYYEFVIIDALTGAETVTCTGPQEALQGYQKPLVRIPCP
jgi:hypothetical protein